MPFQTYGTMPPCLDVPELCPDREVDVHIGVSDIGMAFDVVTS